MEVVTEDTSYLALEKMDEKKGPRFPVYMINDKFGGRGLNFRAPNNAFGITMLILGTFPDSTSRSQTLMRVGRFSDKCTRIRDSKFPEINEEETVKRRGLIHKALLRIENDRVNEHR